MSKEFKRLLKNLLAIGIVAMLVLLVYFIFFSGNKKSNLEIEDTPIQIESIRTIAEISTVSYKDEVVIDSVEYHSGSSSLFSPSDWVKWYNNNVKRRLTIIVKGEVKYGLSLTQSNYTIKNSADTIWLFLPQVKLLDIIMAPSQTEVFHESGKWDDGARKTMEMQAREKLKQNAEKLNLKERAQENAANMFGKLIRSQKTVIIEFDEDN